MRRDQRLGQTAVSDTLTIPHHETGESRIVVDRVYWSNEVETPRISRHCLTAIAISGPGVQFCPLTWSMLSYIEDEGAQLPARQSP